MREFIALGTSSQAPTRERSHNACLLRWDDESFLMDPGEGAQRQLLLAGISAHSIHHICITHFHGDHCLGLAGIIHRMSLEGCDHPVHVYYPKSGQNYFECLCSTAIYQHQLKLIAHPIIDDTHELIDVAQTEQYKLSACSLDHSVPVLGYRLEEFAGLRFVQEKLEAAGVNGSMVGVLQRKGEINIEGKSVHIEDVTVPRPGNVFAFVMDTRYCPGAVALAQDADLLVTEATYTLEHRSLAGKYFHMTASDAARIAFEAGAHRLALTHFSQRYSDVERHLYEAKEIFSDTIVLNDLDRIVISRRR